MKRSQVNELMARADGRFPEIEEDEPPLYLLENDYRHYYRGASE
ncbi:MAG TPA: hypothetical protein PKI62_13850 [bacterium]|nr:hypothetical protein [bacterium]